MPEPRFEALRLELRKGGVAPHYIDRTITELAEHYSDLERAAFARGCSADEAAATARALLGDERTIAAAVLRRPELLAWSARHPRLAYYGALPGAPLMYCIEHRPELARWGASLGVATAIMAVMWTALNWLIFVA
jgi:hypothetical protein